MKKDYQNRQATPEVNRVNEALSKQLGILGQAGKLLGTSAKDASTALMKASKNIGKHSFDNFADCSCATFGGTYTEKDGRECCSICNGMIV